MKKHFFIVGAQRSGTTYLYELLNEHPEICMSQPMRPEPKYFMNKNQNEVDLNQYFQQFFPHCTGNHKILGEKSTSYYEKEESAQLLASFFPEAKIVFFLRNPLERTLSNYFFSKNHGLETRTLDEVFVENIEPPRLEKEVSVNPFDYLGRSEYVKFVELYRKYFRDDQIKVIVFEQFVNSLKSVQQLYSFLGADAQFVPNGINKIVNASDRSEEISGEVINKLRKHFHPLNKALEEMLDCDLSIWK